MTSIISINPSRCRMWPLHERLEEDLDEKTCKTEIQSFQAHGQLVPVLGRRLQKDPTHDVELIYGARRLFAARYLNMALRVELCSHSDRAGIIAMNLENSQRTDISPYERGLGYARWLRDGHFVSQEDLARTLGLSPSQVSRLLKIAQLPRVVVDAFGGPRELPEAQGVQLAQALETTRLADRCMHAAREIIASASRPPAHVIYRRLLASMGTRRRQKASTRDKVVKHDDGTSLFRVRTRPDSMAIIVPLRGLSPQCVQDITCVIEEVLRP